MALTPTGSIKSLSPGSDSPRPDTAVIIAIRARIEPNRGFWQFQLRPWHYAVSITSTVAVTAAFIALVALHGGIR